MPSFRNEWIRITKLEKRQARGGGFYLALEVAASGPDGNDPEARFEASCSAWHGYLHSIMEEYFNLGEKFQVGISESEEVNSRTGQPYQNIVTVAGVQKPADWDQQLEKQGLKANKGRAAGGNAAGGANPAQVRASLCTTVSRLVAAGLVRNEFEFDAWFWKLEQKVFFKKNVSIGDFNKVQA